MTTLILLAAVAALVFAPRACAAAFVCTVIAVRLAVPTAATGALLYVALA